jgi:pimeloyl-ACP methyl ester carboxylesterase
MPEASSLRILRRDPSMAEPSQGRRVILVHGSMDRASSFTRLMGRLRDWSIVAYDRRGYAGSVAAGPPARFEDQVADLIEVLDGHPAVAFGHSFGGTVVLAAAAAHPDLFPAALVWEPAQPWLPWWPAVKASRGAGVPESHTEEPDGSGSASAATTTAQAQTDERADRAEWFMRRMVGDRIWERLPASTRAQRRAEGDTLHAEITSLGSEPAFHTDAISTPVIVGRGGRSPGYQRRSAHDLATALALGQLAEIDGAGHGAHLTHPAEMAALLGRAAARA